MRIFETARAWIVPGDLGAHELEAFRPLGAGQAELHNGSSGGTTAEQAKEHIYHRAMISSIRSEMNKLSQLLSIPYVVFLTDKAGTILELVCSSQGTREEMDQAELRPGVSLCRQQSGMNAVSLAMEMNCIGVVRGTEHSDMTFKNWNCVCAPLQDNDTVYGYVDISFNRGEPIEFAIPFVQQIAENVMEKWMDKNPEMQQYRLEAALQEYKLTAREQEVAQLWLLEKSALHIGSELGISEGTVRNMLKSIYSKMRVNDRWQFVKRLTS
ncbi:LuxR C-terminal-related transcriptional regulator [Paenibacillus sp. MMS20-IR301]|uniref:LuxR C-terminal-related transcriptional regulator n=1 Tax=Paenibacillus sp. MMS20-IR301 TaxID=2895946 RepID=UPI0028ED3D23|nr:LuxR C-terminal-related transcriptional regulator [Paenibacillus sp. MMS20-IR301]WNS42715.1 LuxR C-terminal-related transcriptional regulator [Paenibacillus sp. MMS20-IR301]